MSKFDDLIKEKIELIDRSPERFHTRVEAAQSALWRAIESDFAKLETKDGKVVQSRKNLATINRIISTMQTVMSAGEYAEAVKSFLADFDQAAKLTNSIAATIDKGFQPMSIARIVFYVAVGFSVFYLGPTLLLTFWPVVPDGILAVTVVMALVGAFFIWILLTRGTQAEQDKKDQLILSFLEKNFFVEVSHFLLRDVKNENDAVFKVIDEQQNTLQSDADNLAELQTQASGAQGQMEAIQAANQLASAQTNQLLQIRSLLVAQQNAAATLAQAQADKEAQQIAADEKVLAGQNTPSPKRIW